MIHTQQRKKSTKQEDNLLNGRRVLLSHKKEWSLAICKDVDRTRVYYAKWNKSVREKQTPYDFTHMWNLRNKTNEQREKNKRERETSQETDS